MSTVQAYQKGSVEFAMFGDYFNLVKGTSTPPVTGTGASQEEIDAWWKNTHKRFVDFGEKYRNEKCGSFANGLAVAALEELDRIAQELDEVYKEQHSETSSQDEKDICDDLFN